jgi:hypothetical protein
VKLFDEIFVGALGVEPSNANPGAGTKVKMQKAASAAAMRPGKHWMPSIAE